jgi:uncharacterized Zn-binding protein involved in type VI secretion
MYAGERRRVNWRALTTAMPRPRLSSPRLADGCLSPAMQEPSHSRPAASAALSLLCGVGRPSPGPKRSSRLRRPRDRNARIRVAQPKLPCGRPSRSLRPSGSAQAGHCYATNAVVSSPAWRKTPLATGSLPSRPRVDDRVRGKGMARLQLAGPLSCRQGDRQLGASSSTKALVNRSGHAAASPGGAGACGGRARALPTRPLGKRPTP